MEWIAGLFKRQVVMKATVAHLCCQAESGRCHERITQGAVIERFYRNVEPLPVPGFAVFCTELPLSWAGMRFLII